MDIDQEPVAHSVPERGKRPRAEFQHCPEETVVVPVHTTGGQRVLNQARGAFEGPVGGATPLHVRP